MGNPKEDWDVMPLYESGENHLHQDVDTGRGYMAQVQHKTAPTSGIPQASISSGGPKPGMGGSNRAAKPAKPAGPRKMTEQEMMAWAKGQLADTQMQHQAQVANGPSVQDIGQAMDDHAGYTAAEHKSEMGHAEDSGPEEVPEWLTRYMADQR